MIIYSNYLVEVHQILHCVILFSKPFASLHSISLIIKTITKNAYVRSVSEKVLLNPGYATSFTCDFHVEWGKKLAARTVGNKLFNNKQKHTI